MQLKRKRNAAQLSAKIDVWAFGVLLVELFADTPIWDDMDDTMIREELLQGRPPDELEELLEVEPKESVGHYLHALARACFLKDPNKRPGMEMVVKGMQELSGQVGRVEGLPWFAAWLEGLRAARAGLTEFVLCFDLICTNLY